ncbi:hypothetical protein ACFL96_02520 [Thermoproteota archaeon]
MACNNCGPHVTILNSIAVNKIRPT